MKVFRIKTHPTPRRGKGTKMREGREGRARGYGPISYEKCAKSHVRQCGGQKIYLRLRRAFIRTWTPDRKWAWSHPLPIATKSDLDDFQLPVKSQVASCFRFRDIAILVIAFPTLPASMSDSRTIADSPARSPLHVCILRTIFVLEFLNKYVISLWFVLYWIYPII